MRISRQASKYKSTQGTAGELLHFPTENLCYTSGNGDENPHAVHGSVARYDMAQRDSSDIGIQTFACVVMIELLLCNVNMMMYSLACTATNFIHLRPIHSVSRRSNCHRTRLKLCAVKLKDDASSAIARERTRWTQASTLDEFKNDMQTFAKSTRCTTKTAQLCPSNSHTHEYMCMHSILNHCSAICLVS